MFIALGVLLALVSLCPALLTVDGHVLPSLAPLLVAAGLILVSLNLPAADAQRFSKLAGPFVIVAAIPAIWIIFQMIPLPASRAQPSTIFDFANPVWPSVAAGFRHGVAGRVSVDIGATAMALAWYLSIVGAILLSAAITINRDRAELVLVSLTAATALIAFVVACAEMFDLSFPAARQEALDCACLGIILSAASACLVFERRETRRAKSEGGNAKFPLAAFGCIAAFLVCAIALVAARSGSLFFAASCGFVLFGAVILVRRLDLGGWGAAAIGVTASIIAIALVSGAAGSSSDPRLAFVKKDPASVELMQRMLMDTPFSGAGAGTFKALLPIYQSPNPGAGEVEAATAAAKLSIEMGRPFLWAAVLAAAIVALWLLRAAARRGRDSFYPAAGAACTVTLIILAFVNVGLFGAALPLLASIILGLALAQSQGRASS